jgi:hypothetical protein
MVLLFHATFVKSLMSALFLYPVTDAINHRQLVILVNPR